MMKVKISLPALHENYYQLVLSTIALPFIITVETCCTASAISIAILNFALCMVIKHMNAG